MRLIAKAGLAAGVVVVAYVVVIALGIRRAVKGGEFLEDFGGED